MTVSLDLVVTLAGVGGDSHSVGLIVLHRALLRGGYRVHYLGNQRTVQEVCEAARGADAVLISNMDGHARHYLADLPSVRAESGADAAVWYLGGNPVLTETPEAVAHLLGLGFDRVFPGHVEPDVALSVLAADLRAKGISGRPRWQAADAVPADPPVAAADAARTAAWTGPGRGRRAFDEERRQVLDGWRTGHEARDLARNAEVLHERTWLADRQAEVAHDSGILVHPRAGVAGQQAQRRLLRALRAAGADTLSFQVDSLTRHHAYEDIELIFKRAQSEGVAPDGLNGYPAVNHGAGAMREITAEFADLPLQVRHSTRDPRLLAEISFAAGVAAFEGGPITYNMPYYRDYPPQAALADWRYVDRLAGLYHRRFGVVIDREFFGVLTAVLVPPCLAVAVNVLEALLAAREGVRSVSLGYAEQGNRAQDIGAIRALGRLGRDYLDRAGFGDVAVYTVFHQYMGAFPQDVAKAATLLAGSAASARLSGAHRLMVKSAVEAVRIPSAEDNAAAMALVREALGGAEQAAGGGVDEAAIERELIEREATAIIDTTLRLGEGDPACGVVRAIASGIIDIPFSPSSWNAGLLLTVRDLSGAVRFAETGALPLPLEVVAFHSERVAERLRGESRPIELVVESDILGVARGEFAAWPLRAPTAVSPAC